jgi:lysophospholipase L1-like esterase
MHEVCASPPVPDGLAFMQRRLGLFQRLGQRLSAALKARVSRHRKDSSVPAASLLSDGEAPKRIMVFGDSNSFRPDGGHRCWPALLEDKAPPHLHIFNESCDGRTTRYDTAERNGLDAIRSKLTAHAPLDYVITMLGTNDLKGKYGPPSAADVADGMGRILDVIDAHSGGAEVILVTPPPLGNVTSGDLAGAGSRISAVAAEYRSLAMARDIRLIDIYAILNSSTDLGPDKIHLNARGRHKVADAVWTNLTAAR